MKINSQALRCFLAVAQHESYTKAATALAASQPGVHQYVRRLEAELNTRLVEQHGKRVVLTEHGRVVYQYARRLADEETDLVRYLRDDISLDQGQIRVGGGTTAAEFIIPTIAVAFQRLHPGIEIRVSVADAEVARGVAGRIFDLGILSDATPAPGIDKVPILEDTLVGIAPASHRFASARRPVAPKDLADERVVRFAADEPAGRAVPIQALISNWFLEGGLELRTGLVIGSLQGMKRAVRDGAGVAIVSQYAVDPEDTGLRTFPLASPPRRDFFIVSRDHGWESNVVRAFREFAMSLQWAKDDPRNFRPSKAATGGARARSV